MSEEELEEYLHQIDSLEQDARKNRDLVEQCRDDDGYVVPGCTYVLPAPTEA